MSKINIYSSVEDEYLKTAIEKGWLKKEGENPDFFTSETNPLGKSMAPKAAPAIAPWESLPQSKAPAPAPKTMPLAQKPVTNHKIYKSPLIEQVQQVLSETIYKPGEIDGIWGKNTSKAWNSLSEWYKKNYGGEIGLSTAERPPTQENMEFVITQLGPAIVKKPAAKQMVSTGPAVKEHIPAMADDDFLKEAEMPLTPEQKKLVENIMQSKNVDFESAVTYAKQFYPNLFAVSQPEKQDFYSNWAKQVGQKVEMPQAEDILKNLDEKMKSYKPQLVNHRDDIEVTAPKPASTFEAVPEHIPSFTSNVAFVINELISLANDLDAMNEIEAANAIDKELNIYKSAMDKLYDITGETGEKFVDSAHDKSPVIAPAKENGGMVENVIEQQKKDIEVALKNPTGKYAAIITKLIATANKLDEEGDEDGARIVDKTIMDLRKRVLPFVNRNSVLKATSSEDKKALVNKIAGENAWQIAASLHEQLKKLYRLVDNVGKDAVTAQGEIPQILRQLTAVQRERDEKRALEYLSGVLDLIANFNDKIDAESAFGSSDWKDWDSFIEKVHAYNREIKSRLTSEKSGSQSGNSSMDKLRKDEYSKYIGTLNKLEQVISKNNRIVEQVFGNNSVPEWLKKIKEERDLAQKYDWKQLRQSNDAIFNKLIPYLKYRKIWASNKIVFKKQAAGLADLLQNIPAIPAQKGKVAPGKGRAVRSTRDPQVEELQKALLASGISPGKIDGIWGPNTAKAYNKFIDLHGGVEKFLQPIANPNIQRHKGRPVENLQKATQIVQYYARKNNDASSIELSTGISIPIQSLKDPQSFVDYMQTTLESKSFPPNVALQYLRELSQYVNNYEVELEGKQPGSVKKWQSAIFNLTRNFQKFNRNVGTSEKSDPKAPKSFKYPWETEVTENMPNKLDIGRSGGLNTPEGILTALYQMVNIFGNTNADILKNQLRVQNKDPNRYLQEQYTLLGKIGNALISQEKQIRSAFGNEKFENAMSDYKSLYPDLSELAKNLKTSLVEEQKKAAPVVNKPTITPQHEAERASAYNPNLREYTNPLTGEKAVIDTSKERYLTPGKPVGG